MTQPPGKRVVLVAAVADNGVIGVGGRLPWHLPEDLAHFRRVTTGQVVVMGRRTFDSLGRPLPRRANIVVTRQPDWSAAGVLVAHDVEEAMKLAADLAGDTMVIGGSQVYATALPVADRLLITEVHATPDGDVRFPDYERSVWHETSRTSHRSENGTAYDFVVLDRAR